ncbi:MAG: hypothetical protein KR126chlam1_01021 [Chlamydiae bacterium]|nr:hypothetical protein [Chlamydiota bacterium]
MEFHKLYYSLFQDAESHLQIVRILSKKRHGLNRLDLLKQAGIKSSSRSQKILEELEASGFLMALPEVGKKARDKCYYLSDEYSLFYLNWIEPVKSTLLQGVEKDYWIKQQASPSWKSWAGFAFESLCQKHISRIKDALQIGAVTSSTGYWHAFSNGKKEGAIDLVIDRADQCINLCEIKFHLSEFVVSKSYAQELAKKSSLFRERTKTKKALFVTLITPYGAKENAHYLSSVNSQLTLDALF